nr:MAG TPA: hypothetical protein [Bacteriophage sp.]
MKLTGRKRLLLSVDVSMRSRLISRNSPIRKDCSQMHLK